MNWRLLDYNTLTTPTIGWLWQINASGDWWAAVLVGVLLLELIAGALLFNSGVWRWGNQSDREIKVRDDRIADLRDRWQQERDRADKAIDLLLRSVGVSEEQQRILHDKLDSDAGVSNRRRELATALLDAFPSEDALKQMLYLYMDGLNLSKVAAGGDLATIVTNLLIWAEANERTDDLVSAALRANPDNRKLLALRPRR